MKDTEVFIFLPWLRNITKINKNWGVVMEWHQHHSSMCHSFFSLPFHVQLIEHPQQSIPGQPRDLSICAPEGEWTWLQREGVVAEKGWAAPTSSQHHLSGRGVEGEGSEWWSAWLCASQLEGPVALWGDHRDGGEEERLRGPSPLQDPPMEQLAHPKPQALSTHLPYSPLLCPNLFLF